MNHFAKNITFLNFDHTVENQKLLLEYTHEQIDFLDLSGVHGYCSRESSSIIQNRLSQRKKENPIFLGNGNIHYISYFLLTEIGNDFQLVLFDHHTDAMMDDGVILSCGSWVSRALNTLPHLKKVVIIGVSDPSLLYSRYKDRVVIIPEEEVNQTSSRMIEQKIKEFLLSIKIYISVDKDVLYEKYAHTNWDQGSMSLFKLLHILRFINKQYEICGLDVCGEYPVNPTEMLVFNPRLIHVNEIANRAIIDSVVNHRLGTTS